MGREQRADIGRGMDRTPGEKWRRGKNVGHWYGFAADFVTRHLGNGPGRCLVIGSPEDEVAQIKALGWDVTYLDVRRPPFEKDVAYVAGDASKMPFADAEFDALSSTCVLTHVGTGRYGDAVEEDGDILALAEMARCMKPGAKATIMPGGYYDGENVVLLSKAHRIYSPREVTEMMVNAGLEELAREVYLRGKELSRNPKAEDYVSVLVRKC